MESLLEGGDDGAGEGEFPLEFGCHDAGLDDVVGRVGQGSAEFAQHRDGFLQDGQFINCERWIRGEMGTHERRDVPGGRMPRCLARSLRVLMSPGRSRIVIRSVDGSGSGGGVLVSAGTETRSLSNRERIAISASVDSETRSLVASSANRRLSSAEGRAVMEGLRDVEMVSFTRRILLVLQNADISLSCHQNNTDSDMGCSNSVVVMCREWIRQSRQQ